jgi:hypothetical protein
MNTVIAIAVVILVIAAYSLIGLSWWSAHRTIFGRYKTWTHRKH